MKKTASQIADEVLAKLAAPPSPAQIASMKAGVTAGKQKMQQGTLKQTQNVLKQAPAAPKMPFGQ